MTRPQRPARTFRFSEPLESRRLFAAPSASVPFGLIDTSFGTKGHAYATGKNFDTAKQVVIGGDGKTYVAAGNYVTRFTAAGRLDSTFGTRGIVALPGGTFIAEAVDASGRLNVLVTLSTSNQLRTALLRYTAAGQIDSGFGTGGSTVVTTDASFTPTGLAVQADGKAVIAGTEITDSGDGRETRLFRTTASGAADTSFGTGGSVQTYLGSNTALTSSIYDVIDGVRVLSSGQIEIGGGTVAYAPSDSGSAIVSDSYAVVARFTTAGALETGFASGGIARSRFFTTEQATPYGNYYIAQTVPTKFDARADGSAVLAGDRPVDNRTRAVVVAFNSTGGVTYSEEVPSDSLVTSNASVSGVTALPDGRAVLSRADYYRTPLTVLSASGGVGPTTTADDQNNATIDVASNTLVATAAANGQLLIAGVNSSTTLVLQQENVSTAAAPRADDFPHAGPSSIAVTNEYVFAAYYDTAARNLKFVRRLPNGQWAAPITVDPHIGAGLNLSLKVDANDQPIIAYYDSRSRTLKAASSEDSGQTFTLASVDATPGVGQSVAGALNAGTGSLDFAYYDATNGNLKLATRNRLGRWSTTVVDASKDNVGQQLAITVNGSTNHVMIAYSDATIGQLKYAGQTSTGFQFKTVATAGKGVESLAILSTSNDLPAIAYHDLANDEVRLSVFRSGATRFATHTIANHTGQSIALATSYTSDDPNVLIYSKYTKRVSLLIDPLADRTVETIFSGGGSYLNAVYDGDSTLVSFVDSAGALEVRDTFTV